MPRKAGLDVRGILEHVIDRGSKGGLSFHVMRITNGQVSKKLLPMSYNFSMTYGFAHQEKTQNIATDPTVVFQTGQVHSDSNSCANYYPAGWCVFNQDMELLPVSYTFRFNDGTRDSPYTIATGTLNHIH
jgi:hypothetical protein